MTKTLLRAALLIAACAACSDETGVPNSSPNNAAASREPACPDVSENSALPAARTIIFAACRDPVTVAGGGTEVTLRPKRSPDGGIEVDAAIRIAGQPPITVGEEFGSSANFGRWVGIGKLSERDSAPSVLLGGYTGGAHCCATLQAIVPDRGRLMVLEFAAIDGEPDEDFPRDISGDGVVDIVRQDDRFRYAFSGGAASFSPPVVYNIAGGRIVDVSRRPAFRPLWERFAEETRTRCSDRSDPQRNGACAAYGAAAARLGRYRQARREIDRFAHRETTSARFTAGLTEFLRSNGYLE